MCEEWAYIVCACVCVCVCVCVQALLIHGPEGAANRHLNDTLRTHALIPGWAATATKACTDRVARVMSNKVNKLCMDKRTVRQSS